MSYTNTWSDTRPLGSGQANTADDEIRTLRLDLHERMEAIFENWTADPLVVKQSAFGNATGKVLTIHGTAFVVEPSETASLNYDDNGVTNVSNLAQPIRAWVPLPSGVVITNINWVVSNGDAGATSLILGALTHGIALSVETLSSLASSVSGVSAVDSGVIALTTIAGKAYFLKADRGGGAEFGVHSVQITYNTPDSRSTI